jgi:hypothetical protein
MAKRGRPTKYRKEHCQAILDFFNKPATKTVKQTWISKAGIKEADVEVAIPLPTIEGFALSIGTSKQSVITWTEQHPEFLDAYTRAKTAQKEILIQNALAGRYVEGFAKFVAINCTDMVDKQTQEHTGKDGGPIETKVVNLTDDELLNIARGSGAGASEKKTGAQ